ncbi:MAG: hypothetical protein CL912_26345 [Deltaproteobacteria bacterium]|nr:hypothetical protein [Deltaproteobacteria bacterium]
MFTLERVIVVPKMAMDFLLVMDETMERSKIKKVCRDRLKSRHKTRDSCSGFEVGCVCQTSSLAKELSSCKRSKCAADADRVSF